MRNNNINTILTEISQEIKAKSNNQTNIKDKLNKAENKLTKLKTKWKKDTNIDEYQKRYDELKDLYLKELERSVIIIETDGREEQRHKSSTISDQITNSHSRNKYVEVNSFSLKSIEEKKEEAKDKETSNKENQGAIDNDLHMKQPLIFLTKIKVILGLIILLLVILLILLLSLLLKNKQGNK